MPTFQYDSVLTSGDQSSGTIEASDRADAVRMLRRRGEVATRVAVAGSGGARRAAVARASSNGAGARKGGGTKPRPIAARPKQTGAGASRGGQAAASGGITFGKAAMSRIEFATFVQEIATALEAGLPLMASLRAISEQATSPRQQEIVDHLMDRIEAGRSFAQAASEWGKPFDDMALGMLRAGEASGKLDQVMLQLAQLLERDGELRRAVKGAMIYPLVLACLLGVGIGVIVTFVIPRVMGVLSDQGVTMPWPTRVVQGFAEFVSVYWWAILGGLGLLVMLYRWMVTNPEPRLRYHSLLLQIPVMGHLLRDVAVARFTRTMGTMLGAGIGVLDALMITRDTLGNNAIEVVLDDVAEQVKSGRSIAEPMDESGHFPPLLIQVINLGEKSGRLDSMLLHASDSFDKRTQSTIKTFTTLLPVAVLMVMALVVLFVLAAALLPLLEMQASFG